MVSRAVLPDPCPYTRGPGMAFTRVPGNSVIWRLSLLLGPVSRAIWQHLASLASLAWLTWLAEYMAKVVNYGQI